MAISVHSRGDQTFFSMGHKVWPSSTLMGHTLQKLEIYHFIRAYFLLQMFVSVCFGYKTKENPSWRLSNRKFDLSILVFWFDLTRKILLPKAKFLIIALLPPLDFCIALLPPCSAKKSKGGIIRWWRKMRLGPHIFMGHILVTPVLDLKTIK